MELFLPDSDASYICHCVFTVLFPFYIPYAAIYYINKVYITCSFTNTCDDISMADYRTPEIQIMYAMSVINCFVYYMALRVVDALKTGGSLRGAFFLKVTTTVSNMVS